MGGSCWTGAGVGSTGLSMLSFWCAFVTRVAGFPLKAWALRVMGKSGAIAPNTLAEPFTHRP